MLELKNHLLATSASDTSPSIGKTRPSLEMFHAMQKLSLFMLSRTAPDSKASAVYNIDEATKSLIRSVFNE
jgi:hypothetical protein